MENPLLCTENDFVDEIIAHNNWTTEEDLTLISANMLSQLDKIRNNLALSWVPLEEIYRIVREGHFIEQDEEIKKYLEEFNGFIIKMYGELIASLCNINERSEWVKQKIKLVLENENLEAIFFKNSLTGTLLAYGNHLVNFKDQMILNRAYIHRVIYMDDWNNRMAGTRLGTQIYDYAHKSSNEVFVRSMWLSDLIKDMMTSPGHSNWKGFTERYIELWIAIGIHLSIFNAEPLYLCSGLIKDE